MCTWVLTLITRLKFVFHSVEIPEEICYLANSTGLGKVRVVQFKKIAGRHELNTLIVYHALNIWLKFTQMW